MKRELVKKLEKLDEINKEELNMIIEAFNKNKKYGLVWEDHPEDVELELKDGTFKIEEVKEKRIEMNPGGRENLLIEGDNLHSLMMMKEAGMKVDLIYIDVPYNTMNEEGFRYNDKRIDGNDEYRHSKWLSFMEKRLKLARELMMDDGVIFISIDDNEQANLKLLMDEVFGEEDFIANMIYKKTGQQQNNGKNVAVTHEYILLYARKLYRNNTKKDLIKGDSIVDREGYNQYRNTDKKGRYRLNPIQDRSLGKYEYSLIHPITNEKVKSANWRMKKEKFLELENKDMIHWTLSLPNVKKYLDKNAEVLINNYIDGFYNEQGDTILKSILGNNLLFNNPKNHNLIINLISRIRNNNATILDFFAGSGTTGQAVMELNKEDGGNRRFILCTNNENNICEEVTYERNKRVITGKWAKGDMEPLPNNLSYYKVGIINKNHINFKDKKKIDSLNQLLMLSIRDELKIEKINENYAVLKNKEDKVLFIINEIINDDIRKLNIEDFNKTYTPIVSNRDKCFKGIDESKITYY